MSCGAFFVTQFNFKKWTLLFSKDALIKSDSKDVQNATEHFYFKSMVFLNFIFLKESSKYIITVYTKIWSSTTVLIIQNVYWAANQHIRTISEGSRLSNDIKNNISQFY